MEPFGRLSHVAISRPPAGRADRNVRECAWTRRRFVELSATITQVATKAGSQPRLLAMTGAQARLPIDLPQKILDVDDVGLELDDQERSRSGMPRKDVHDAALPVDGEALLGDEGPTGQLLEQHGRPLVECGVARIDGTIELAAVPLGDEVEPDLQRSSNPTQRRQGHGLEMPPLNVRHDGPTDICPIGDVLLPKASSDAHRAKDGPNALVDHDPSIAVGAYARLITAFERPYAGRGSLPFTSLKAEFAPGERFRGCPSQ